LTEPAQLFLRQYVPIGTYKPRMMLNGFPKAGLHLLELMARPLINPSDVGRNGSQWIGTFKWHSWTNEWQNMRRYLWRASCLERGTYLMGHSAYHQDIEKLFYYANIGHIFIYRDLRDVAVSQTHHILDDGRPNLQHAHKDLYKMLGGFDEALTAVIAGMGPYPGIVERWEPYAPWLARESVLCIKYEDAIAEPHKIAGQIIGAMMNNATDLLEGGAFKFELDENTFNALAEQMVVSGQQTQISTTYRQGKAGSWRDVFTDEHKMLFKKHDPDNWLIRLNYEENEDW
jgi:hypothetical protein